MSKCLIIPDLHLPCSRPHAIEFCKEIQKKYKCDTVVFIGDILDFHAVSFHAQHPEMPGPTNEFTLAYQELQRWYKAFPKAKVCIGNHDYRVIRLAESVNIPKKFLREFAEVWDTPKWDWKDEHIIDNVLYFHGTGGGGGLIPAYNKMKSLSMSVVLGHFHSRAGIKFLVSHKSRLFGMDVGTLINDRSMAFAYGKYNVERSVLSCGVVINGHPYLELMPISKGEKFYNGVNNV